MSTRCGILYCKMCNVETLFTLPGSSVHLLDRQHQPPVRIDGDLRIYRQAVGRELCLEFGPSQISGGPAKMVTQAVYAFEFELRSLKGYTQVKNPDRGAPSVTFHLEDGQKKGPVYTNDANNLQRLTEHLAGHFVITLVDPASHFFTTKLHDPDALHLSLTELNFFTPQQPKKPSLIHRFYRDPVGTGLSQLGKVARAATDNLAIYAYGSTHAQPDYRVPNFRDLEATAEPPVVATSVEDGFEVFSKPTVLPKRLEAPRGPEVTEEEFGRQHLDPEGRVLRVDELRERIFRGGIHASARKTLWKFLLDYSPWEATDREREAAFKQKSADYYRMKTQWKSISADQESRFTVMRDRRSLVEKDVFRTDRTLDYFSQDKGPGLELLTDILMTYGMYNFDLGYVQGMSDLLSPLLVVMETEVDAFWCFAGFLRRVERNFDIDQAGTKLQMSQLHLLVTVLLPDLAAYLDQQDSANMYFCFRWILVWFKREFHFHEIYRLWEVMWAGPPNYHLICCCALLESVKNFIMHSRLDFTAILKHINDTAFNIDLERILTTAEAMLRQLEALHRQQPPVCGDLPDEVAEILGFPPPAQASALHPSGGAGGSGASRHPGSALRVQ